MRVAGNTPDTETRRHGDTEYDHLASPLHSVTAISNIKRFTLI